MRAFRSKCYTVAQMDQKLKAFISNCPPANHSCAGWAQLPVSSCSEHDDFLRCNNLCSGTSQQLRRSLWCHPNTAIATRQSCSPCPVVACPEHSHPAGITAGDCQHIETQLHRSGLVCLLTDGQISALPTGKETGKKYELGSIQRDLAHGSC